MEFACLVLQVTKPWKKLHLEVMHLLVRKEKCSLLHREQEGERENYKQRTLQSHKDVEMNSKIQWNSAIKEVHIQDSHQNN